MRSLALSPYESLVALGLTGGKVVLHEFQPDVKPRTLSAFSFLYQEAPVAIREVELSPDARPAANSVRRVARATRAAQEGRAPFRPMNRVVLIRGRCF